MQMKKAQIHKKLRKLGYVLTERKRHESWEHPDGDKITLHRGTRPKYRHTQNLLKRIRQAEEALR